MRKTIKVCFLLLLTLLLPITALAHSGGTDSSGGHTDHSTGEYHYHHGYPAHDHYDMDGDGVIDCPYDFDDKTNETSGPNLARASRSKITISKIIFIIFCLPAICFMLYFAYIAIVIYVFEPLAKNIKDQRRRKQEELERAKQKEELVRLRQFAKDYLERHKK